MIDRQFCIAVGMLLLAGSQGIAQEPEDVLKTNGLIKNGKFFVLPEEEKVSQGLYNLRPVVSQMETRYNAWGAIIQNEYEFQQLTDYRIAVVGERNDYRVAYNSMPTRTPQERYAKQQASQQLAAYENEIRAVNSAYRVASQAARRSGRETKGGRRLQEVARGLPASEGASLAGRRIAAEAIQRAQDQRLGLERLAGI